MPPFVYPSIPPAPITTSIHLEEYILLPGQDHDKIYYPDLLVAMTTTYNRLDWYQTHSALFIEGSIMLPPRPAIDFIHLLQSGVAYDGNGKKVDKSRLDQILGRMLIKGVSLRAEWLDANFHLRDGQIYIHTHHRIKNGKLKPRTIEPVDPACLIRNQTGTTYINLASVNHQGLPTREANTQTMMRYRCPTQEKDNTVAALVAYTGGSALDCASLSTLQHSGRGVRPAKIRDQILKP